MNDIKILQEMLSSSVRVPLQHDGSWSFVELKDKQAETNVKIKEIPHNSIVIRADAFEFKSPAFAGSKNERKRADFVIVSNEAQEKWIICIEIKRGNIQKSEVTAQLRGARCVMDYCKSIGGEFWAETGFLTGYEYRFVGIARLSIQNQPTRTYVPNIQSQGELHSRPDVFLQILESADLSFHNLIDEAPDGTTPQLPPIAARNS